jgi:hypothetical protein
LAWYGEWKVGAVFLVKYLFVSLLFFLLLFGIGCGGGITAFSMSVVADEDLCAGSGVRLMESDGAVFVEESIDENGRRRYRFANNVLANIDAAGVTRVKYHREEFAKHKYMVVEGRMGGDKVYPVVLDTGAGLRPVILQDVHIRDNDLRVHPFVGGGGERGRMTLTAVDELVIGNMKLSNYPGICWGQHVEWRLFGVLPVGRSEDISFPLLLMSQFRYFMFDNVNERAEFSFDESFDPVSEEGWYQFPLSLEQIGGGEQAVLFVEMEVNGQVLRAMLDTGCGVGFMMNRSLWDEMAGQFDVTGRKSRRFILPLHFEGNDPKCSGFIVKELKLGEYFSVKGGEITVLPDSKSWKRADCILGMGYFLDRVVVVDFERSKLWVRK